MKTFKFSLVLRTRENTDVFISLDDNIYGIHSKRINILYILHRKQNKQRRRNCNSTTAVDGHQINIVQSNFNGSNIFGTMEICSRHG